MDNKPPILQFAEFFCEKMNMNAEQMIKGLECLEKGMPMYVSMQAAYGLIKIEEVAPKEEQPIACHDQ